MIRTLAAGSLALLAALIAPALIDSLIDSAGAENGFHDLTGEFYVIDDAPDLAPTMFIGLTGEAAQLIYEGIATEAETNECMGGLMKFMADGGYCTLSEDGQYFCSFSIEVQTGKFTGGESC